MICPDPKGLEDVFIVIAIGAAGVGLLIPASVGALAALVLVLLLGVIVHPPVTLLFGWRKAMWRRLHPRSAGQHPHAALEKQSGLFPGIGQSSAPT